MWFYTCAKASPVVAVRIEEATAKIRTGGPEDYEEDYALPVWAGVVPIRQMYDDLIDDARLAKNIQAQSAALEQDKLDAPLYDDLDEALHAEIMAAMHSSRAQHLLEEVRVMLDRPRFQALGEVHRPEDTFEEHRRIVDAIGTGDPELAAAAMRVHLAKVAAAIDAKLRQIEETDEQTT